MLQQALSDARMVKIIHVQGLRHHHPLMRITDFLCTQDTRWFLQAWSWRIISATDVSGQPWDSLEEAILVDFDPPQIETSRPNWDEPVLHPPKLG